MRQRVVRGLGLLAIVTGALLGGLPASAAPGVIQDTDSAAYPWGEDMYQALNQGQAFQCLNDTPCHITATIKVSKGEAKYLGLSSRTLAHGKPVGPKTVGFNGDRQDGIYLLAFPSWLKKKIVAKHVVAMNVFITLTTFYSAPDDSGNMQTHESVWPTPGNTSRFLEGQGSRYGCRTVAGGNIILGYVHQGQSCP